MAEMNIKQIIGRLLAEDVGATLDGLTIPQVREKRSKMYLGEKMGVCYRMLSSAYEIIQAGNYHCPDSFKDILRQYQEEDSRLDCEYAGSIQPLTRSKTQRDLSRRATLWRISIQTNIWKPYFPSGMRPFRSRTHLWRYPCSGTSMPAI